LTLIIIDVFQTFEILQIMKLVHRHPWNLNPKQAIALQAGLSKNLVYSIRGKCPVHLDELRIIAGADVSYSKKTDTCYAAIVMLDFSTGEIIEERTAVKKSAYPYIPGLLSFREAPPLIAAFSRLKHDPDLLIFDAQGIAHTRRFGLASHMGYIYEKPSIGCAKSLLVGEFNPPGEKAGDWSYIHHKGEIIGMAYRLKSGCKPVFLSPGHLMDMEWIRRFFARCGGEYRIPDIIRLPHILSNKIRREDEDKGIWGQTLCQSMWY
jgi:deoxyribonuclease V